MSEYTVDYFIEKLSGIPEEKWCTDTLNGPNDTHCALGHCSSMGDEQYSLALLFGMSCSMINDGFNPKYKQPTPKQRILAALSDIKAKSQPQNPTPTNSR